MSNLKEIIKIREKIFKTKKYNIFENTLNKMMIPKKFELNDCIPSVFGNKNYKKINRFEYGEYKKLYVEMKKETINLPIKKNPIIVVHPFYPILRHANFLANDKEYLKKYIKYEKQMIELLKNCKSDIILFESPDSFARYTYTFLKYKRIKKVILTEHSFGKVLDIEELKNIDITNAKIIGCYGEHCIKDVENQLSNIKIERIDNLIMERFC